MRESRSPVAPVLTAITSALLLAGMLVATPAAAHEERAASFPDGSGQVPRYLGLDNPRHRVVCTDESAELVREMPASRLKKRNRELLGECEFDSIQDAINSIERPRTSIYVLPGYYTEKKWTQKEKSDYCANLGTESENPLELPPRSAACPPPAPA